MEKEQKCKLGKGRCLNQVAFVFLDLSHTFIITCNSSKISARPSLEGIDASSRHRTVLFGGHKLNNREPSFLQRSLRLIMVGAEFTEYLYYTAYYFTKHHQKKCFQK